MHVTPECDYELFSPDVISIPTPPGGPGATGMLNTIAFLGQVVPDLTWTVRELIALADGPVVVTVDAGKIVHVYHLEDWTGAIAQLTAAA